MAVVQRGQWHERTRETHVRCTDHTALRASDNPPTVTDNSSSSYTTITTEPGQWADRLRLLTTQPPPIIRVLVRLIAIQLVTSPIFARVL